MPSCIVIFLNCSLSVLHAKNEFPEIQFQIDFRKNGKGSSNSWSLSRSTGKGLRWVISAPRTNFLSCFPFLHVTITKSTHCLQSQPLWEGGVWGCHCYSYIYSSTCSTRGWLGTPLVCTLFRAEKRLELMTAMFIQGISQESLWHPSAALNEPRPH